MKVVVNSSHSIKNQTYKRKAKLHKNQSQPQQVADEIKTEPSQTSHQMRDQLSQPFGTNNSLNNVLYPASLDSLPQVVLMNLVQSGHLQVEGEGKLKVTLPNNKRSKFEDIEII